MKSEVTRKFRVLFRNLPPTIRKIATENYLLWKKNSKHPSLHFKAIAPKHLKVWSVRVGLEYRALALVENNTAKRFWIGSHKEYDEILKSMKSIRKNL